MYSKENLTPYQKDVYAGKICPACKSTTMIKTEMEVYGRNFTGKQIITCINFPKCDNYVGTHKDGTALGRLAGQQLRLMKKKTHDIFDAIWKNHYMERGDAYKEMSEFLNLDPELTHIGYFNYKTCEKVFLWAQNLYVELSTKK